MTHSLYKEYKIVTRNSKIVGGTALLSTTTTHIGSVLIRRRFLFQHGRWS